MVETSPRQGLAAWGTSVARGTSAWILLTSLPFLIFNVHNRSACSADLYMFSPGARVCRAISGRRGGARLALLSLWLHYMLSLLQLRWKTSHDIFSVQNLCLRHHKINDDNKDDRQGRTCYGPLLLQGSCEGCPLSWTVDLGRNVSMSWTKLQGR